MDHPIGRCVIASVDEDRVSLSDCEVQYINGVFLDIRLHE